MTTSNRVTPGPWTAKQLTLHSTAWVLLWPSAAGQHMKRIDRAGEFMEGDARLIAAAPELLEALRGVLAHMPVPSSICAERPAYEAARAAVAKANGA